MTSNVLVLAGTADATRLAVALDAAGHQVTSSFAGVTTAPIARPGTVRTGGFGGPSGLAAYLRAERFDAVIDATHPFAAHMPFHVAAASAEVGVRHCRLLRSPWIASAGDRWMGVASIDAAPDALVALGARRVFLAVGRQSVAPFAAMVDRWFLVRSIEPLDLQLPHVESLLSRGPFDADGEIKLLQMHKIDALVTKNAGGTATAAKLAAARELGLPVVMVDRPPQPPGIDVVPDVGAALAWLGADRPDRSPGASQSVGDLPTV